MNSFERLLEHTDTQHIRVLEKQFKSNAKGLIKGNKIAIRQDIPTVEKASVLAEELGHYYTTVGNILDQEDAGNRKQEHKARTWAYNRLIGLSGLVRAYEKQAAGTSYRSSARRLILSLSPMTTMVSSWFSTYSGLISVVSHPFRLMAMMFTP